MERPLTKRRVGLLYMTMQTARWNPSALNMAKSFGQRQDSSCEQRFPPDRRPIAWLTLEL